MRYRVLGKTGLKVSVVGVGTWQFGGEWGKDFTEAEAEAMLDKAAEVGINLIDTAECYGDHLSEELIGKTLPGDRGEWIIATKFGHKFHERFERDSIYAPDEVRKQLEASLRALRTDYVDTYQFHSGNDEQFDTEGLWEMLQEEKAKGKIRHLGTSIGSNSNVDQVDKSQDVDSEVIQVVYNRLDRKPEGGVFESCMRQNLGVLARVPLASGYLSGKYNTQSTFPDTDVRGRWHTKARRERALQQVEEIQRTEVPENVSMAQWALAWCLKHPAVTCVIPGCKNVEQVESNAEASELDLVPTDHPQAVASEAVDR
ncbi:MAG: aldo/keto reductase [Planctomycetota bacterium]